MNILNKAREALGQAAAAVSKEAEQLSIQAQLGNLQSDVDRQLIEVGKRARELRTQKRFEDQQIDILLRRVVELEEQMMELRRQAFGTEAPPPPPPPPAPTTPPAPPEPPAETPS